MRHDRVAVVAFLSSRRSSVNVVIVVVQHVCLVIVAVVVVFVAVRLGSWPICTRAEERGTTVYASLRSGSDRSIAVSATSGTCPAKRSAKVLLD